MNENQGGEIVIYQQGDVKITNLRAIIGGKTYIISKLTSIGKRLHKGRGAVFSVIIIFGLLFGLYFLIGGIYLLASGYIFGIVPSLLAVIVVYACVKRIQNLNSTFYLVIGGPSGETEAMKSRIVNEITEVEDALNEAIIRRG